ncbi:sugar phosphate isomerase/epimerase [Candidatus Woesearchaeota archaeon]|nr:sugar phosphate isomerase/epimerase [Candidatus Woesearchaeota archaeon]
MSAVRWVSGANPPKVPADFQLMEFNTNTGYYIPMDRGYFEAMAQGEPKLEEPIVPIHELGQTVPERDPRTGANILQTTEAAIKAGAANIQFVLTTPPESAIGGRPKAYGKDVREAIRELAKANEVMISGVELPTAISNLSGYNPQNGTISDDKRFQDLNEIRDAIRFIGDISGGGAVDVVSMEFPRTVFDATWNKRKYNINGKEIPEFVAYPEEEERAVKHLVDDRTGRVIQEIRLNQEVPYPEWKRAKSDYEGVDDKGNRASIKKGDYVDFEGRKVARKDRVPEIDEEGQMIIRVKRWKDFEDERNELNRELEQKKGRRLRPEEEYTVQEAFMFATTESQESIARGWAQIHGQDVNKKVAEIEKLKKSLEFYKRIEDNLPEEEKWKVMRQVSDETARHITAGGLLPASYKKPSEIIEDAIKSMRNDMNSRREMSRGQLQQAEEAAILRRHITTAEKYAKQKSVEGYAIAGIYAMDETHKNPNVKRDISVGPEIGWPGSWGSHPTEFVELIKKARDDMVKFLTKPEFEKEVLDEQGNLQRVKVHNPHYREMDEARAREEAKKHIKGLFDTSHMGMWYNHFRRVPGEGEEQRLQAFRKWYLDQVDMLAREDVVGSIQAVDSASGAHGHLPPGQGIFPVVEAVKRFKEKGFNGFIVSEGHEEEQFGQGRILTQTWRAFGAPTFRGGYAGGVSWGQFQHSYSGRAYSPYFIFGAYSPSNEWTLWSQVPFE